VNATRLRSLLLGFAVAAAALGVMLWLVDVDEVADALGRADLSLVAVVAALMLGWIAVQGLALWVVWDTLDISVPGRSAVLVFAGAAFVNNVTPFGQAGGEPVAALLTTDVADTDYETALAAIAGADALNFVPSTTLALVGSATYALLGAVDPRLRSVVAIVIVFGTTVATVGAVVWRRRAAVERAGVRLATPPLRVAAAILPRVSVPTPGAIRERIRHFFVSIERIATDRRNLAGALLLSTLGLVLQASAMWVSFRALGWTIPYYVPFFVIPVGTMAAVGPTPGGLGSIEPVHVFLLTSMTGAPAPVVAAAVVIHSVGGFWLTTAAGSASMALLRASAR
jgi:uncharacterized protein (TIRG00374 family)